MGLLNLPEEALDLILEDLASSGGYPYNAELVCKQLFKHLTEFQWQDAAIWVTGHNIQFQTVVADWTVTPINSLSLGSRRKLNELVALLKFRMKFASFGVLNIYLGEFPKGHLPISRLLKVAWSGDFSKKVFLYGDDKRSPSMAHRMLKWKTTSSDVKLSIYSKSAAHIPLCSVGFDFKNYCLGNAFGRYLHALSIKIDDSTHVSFNYALTDCKRLAKLSIFYSVRYQARLVLTESIESLAVHGWFRQLHISKQKGGLMGLLLSRKGNSNPVQVFVPALKVLAITDIVKYGDGWMNDVVGTFADTVETLFIGRKQPSQLVHDPLEIPHLESVMFIADDFGQSEAQEKMSRSWAHDNIHIDSRETNTSIHRVYMALPFQEPSTITKCARALFRTAQELQRIEIFAGFLTQEHVDYLAEYSIVSGRRIVIERENLIGQAH